jgi:GTPase
MFIDQAKINVKAGDGGNGVVAFRREKFVPDGGPSGGDGGRGGDIVFYVDEGLRTLMDFRYRRHFKGNRGEHGQGKNMHGKRGETIEIAVPPGTIIFDDDTGEKVADLVNPSDRVIVARGGRGGRGNARFTSSVNRAPRMAENGEPGQQRWLRLELKLLADVGLVGLPNAGKSTLLASVTEARPKIADYPFTTMTPQLGVVSVEMDKSFVLADIPGLIEGAHSGAGLGHDFLKHIERTRLLIHVLDVAPADGHDPLDDFQTIETELASYDQRLARRPRIVALNKIDIVASEDGLNHIKRNLEDLGYEVHLISAVTTRGVQELMQRVFTLLEELPADVIPEAEEEVDRVYTMEPARYRIEKDGSLYIVRGEDVERMVAMTNFDNEEAVDRLQNAIRKMGIEDALAKKGLKNGDTVSIRGVEFEYYLPGHEEDDEV